MRIVSATNRRLEDEVAAGRFREDVYYRLNVIQLTLPPLRDRPEDIPLLAQHFIRRFSDEIGKEVEGMDGEAFDMLSTYGFPGNVRELENLIERAVALARGPVIGTALLPPTVTANPSAGPISRIDDEGVDLEALVATYERSLLSEALSKTGGIKKKAARLLGISFRSFRYRPREARARGRDARGLKVRFRQGAQAEVLLSLALVMVTGTGLLAALFLEIDQARVERLHGLLSRGFVASVGDSSLGRGPDEQGLWWTVDPLGRATGLNASTAQIDPETLALGLEAFAYTKPIVLSGAPWSPIRFAVLNHHGPGAVVGRIDAPVSGFILAVLLVTDVLIFGLFGVSLLQRRVSGPLHRLATRVREIGQGDLPASVAIEGVGRDRSARFRLQRDAGSAGFTYGGS